MIIVPRGVQPAVCRKWRTPAGPGNLRRISALDECREDVAIVREGIASLREGIAGLCAAQVGQRLSRVLDARTRCPRSDSAITLAGALLEHCLTGELGADPPTLIELALPESE